MMMTWPTRDSAIYTCTALAAIGSFLCAQSSVLTTAFGIGASGQAKIQLCSALVGFVAAYLKMSPMALSPQNTMAHTVASAAQTINPWNPPPKSEV